MECDAGSSAARRKVDMTSLLKPISHLSRKALPRPTVSPALNIIDVKSAQSTYWDHQSARRENKKDGVRIKNLTKKHFFQPPCTHLLLQHSELNLIPS